MSKAKCQITVYPPEATFNLAKRQAKIQGLTLSKLVSQALDQFLRQDQNEDMQAQLDIYEKRLKALEKLAGQTY